MNLQLVISPSQLENELYKKRMTRLQQVIGDSPRVTFSDKHIELIHLVGAADNRLLEVARNAVRKKIPYVYTPLESAFTWNAPAITSMAKWCSMENYLLRHATLIHVCGDMELTELEKRHDKNLIIVIADPYVTRLTTEAQFQTQLNGLYEQATRMHEEHIWEVIQKEAAQACPNDINMQKVHQWLIYVTYLYKRDFIHRDTLKLMAEPMTQLHYDEEAYAAFLHKTGKDKFLARIEFVMQEQGLLTEGFMPLPAREDKAARKINASVFQREA